MSQQESGFSVKVSKSLLVEGEISGGGTLVVGTDSNQNVDTSRRSERAYDENTEVIIDGTVDLESIHIAAQTVEISNNGSMTSVSSEEGRGKGGSVTNQAGGGAHGGSGGGGHSGLTGVAYGSYLKPSLPGSRGSQTTSKFYLKQYNSFYCYLCPLNLPTFNKELNLGEVQGVVSSKSFPKNSFAMDSCE